MHILRKIGLPRLPSRDRNVIFLAVGGIVLFIILFFVVLSPLRRALADKKKQWQELEVQLISNRKKLDSFKIDKAALENKAAALRRRLPCKSPTSAILEELTKKGKGLNIDFISISPQSAEPVRSGQDISGASRCQVLPISINMRASYKSLGEYLSLLENLESSFAIVKEFQVTKDERTFPKLIVNMKVYTYVMEEAGNGEE